MIDTLSISVSLVGNFVNRAVALKGNLMRLFLVLYMKAKKKSPENVNIPFGAFMV